MRVREEVPAPRSPTPTLLTASSPTRPPPITPTPTPKPTPHTASAGGSGATSTSPADNNNNNNNDHDGLTEGLLPTSAGQGAGPSSSAAAAINGQQQQPRPYYAAGAAFLSRNSFRHGALRNALSARADAAAASSVEAAALAALAAHDEEAAAAAEAASSADGGGLVRGDSARPGAAHAHAAKPASQQLGLRTDYLALKEIVFGSWLNLLLVCVPLGAASDALGWGATATFGLNFFALVPLALILGDITEDLAVRFGDTVGGLINATFGNVVEIILSVAALQQGLYQVVAMSLLGSILSNLLLVLGCCFLFGGLYYKQQDFNPVANQASSSLLFLSCIGVVLPTAAAQLAPAGKPGMSAKDVLNISRGTAVVLLAIYVAYLTFQLNTHAHLFGGGEDDGEPVLTLPGAFGALAVVTLAVAASSELLTGSIETFSEETNLSQAFVGMIILPIAGNAAEHVVSLLARFSRSLSLALVVAPPTNTSPKHTHKKKPKPNKLTDRHRRRHEEQDGPQPRRRRRLLHPDRPLRDPLCRPGGLADGARLFARLRPLQRDCARHLGPARQPGDGGRDVALAAGRGAGVDVRADRRGVFVPLTFVSLWRRARAGLRWRARGAGERGGRAPRSEA